MEKSLKSNLQQARPASSIPHISFREVDRHGLKEAIPRGYRMQTFEEASNRYYSDSSDNMPIAAQKYPSLLDTIVHY